MTPDPPAPDPSPAPPVDGRERAWKRSLRLIGVLLAIWFTASLGLGVLFAGPLNQIWVAGFPLGFWFAQQGSIIVFVLLLAVNAVAMDRIERDSGVDANEQPDTKAEPH